VALRQPWWCRKVVLGQTLKYRPAVRFQDVVKDKTHLRKQLALLLVLAPAIAGCSGASDLLSKDAEWFSRPGRLFIRNVSIDTPPLTPDKPVTPDDLVSAQGACPGMPAPGAPADANASTETAPGAQPPRAGTVALGHTECDVVRGIGAPDNVNISNNERGERLAAISWSHGPRAGIYTFTAGRLSSIEGAPAPPTPPTAKSKSKPKKKPAAT
jgi:hypothetical protein